MTGRYNILIAQIAMAGLSRSELAEGIGMRYNTLNRKLRGEAAFTLEEAIAVRQFLCSSLPLEELFERD